MVLNLLLLEYGKSLFMGTRMVFHGIIRKQWKYQSLGILEIVISWDLTTINGDLMVIYPLVTLIANWKRLKRWPIEISAKPQRMKGK